MNKWRFVVLFVPMIAFLGFTQDVPPPPKPPETGPSLEATMSFIQEKLNSIGPVNFIIYYHDNTNGNDWAHKFKIEDTGVRASAADCKIIYHVRATRDDKVYFEADNVVPLKDVKQIGVMNEEQRAKEYDSQSGHPEYAQRVDPPVFLLYVELKAGAVDFNLYDETLANRLAKAIVHAVELCGGGKEQDPF